MSPIEIIRTARAQKPVALLGNSIVLGSSRSVFCHQCVNDVFLSALQFESRHRRYGSTVHHCEDYLEEGLKQRISVFRREKGLTSHWDDELSYILTPALCAYETERVVGTSFGNDDFQTSVKRAVPEGFSFKGFPTMFPHFSVRSEPRVCFLLSITVTIFPLDNADV